MAKEQMRTAAETADQERSINDHSLQLLRDEMAQVKQNLSEVTRRESQVRCIITFVLVKYHVLFRLLNLPLSVNPRWYSINETK